MSVRIFGEIIVTESEIGDKFIYLFLSSRDIGAFLVVEVCTYIIWCWKEITYKCARACVSQWACVCVCVWVRGCVFCCWSLYIGQVEVRTHGKVHCMWEQWEIMVFYPLQSRDVDCFVRKVGWTVVDKYNENDLRVLNQGGWRCNMTWCFWSILPGSLDTKIWSHFLRNICMPIFYKWGVQACAGVVMRELYHCICIIT